MKNFESLLAAYLLAWAVFFGFLVSVSLRLGRAQEELQRLKEKLGQK